MKSYVESKGKVITKKKFKEGDSATIDDLLYLWQKGWKAQAKILDYQKGIIEVPTGHKKSIALKVLG